MVCHDPSAAAGQAWLAPGSLPPVLLQLQHSPPACQNPPPWLSLLPLAQARAPSPPGSPAPSQDAGPVGCWPHESPSPGTPPVPRGSSRGPHGRGREAPAGAGCPRDALCQQPGVPVAFGNTELSVRPTLILRRGNTAGWGTTGGTPHHRHSRFTKGREPPREPPEDSQRTGALLEMPLRASQ